MYEIPEVTSGVDYDAIGNFCQEQRHQSDVSWATGLGLLAFFALLRHIFSGGIEFRYDR